MGMFAFRLTVLLCSLTIYKSLDAASVLDNSSDLWRNWLLNENEEILTQQGPPPARRITPKSVFIAPIFDKCPPGTRLDALGNCVKIVRIDKWEILVSKLNAAFAQSSLKPLAMQNETSTNFSVPPGTTTTTTTSTTLTKTTVTTSTTEVDMPSSTLYANFSEQSDNPKDVPHSEDISGPLQLSIPLSSKNSSENTDDDSSPSFLRGNMTSFLNESETSTTIETENVSEFVTEGYGSGDATTLPQFELNLSTLYPDTNTAESVGSIQSDLEFATEMTTESTTSSEFSTEAPSSPQRFYVHRRPDYESDANRVVPTYITSNRPGLLNGPKVTVTPVPSLIYSYTSGDILKVPAVKFPDSSRRNESSTERVVVNRVPDYLKQNNSVNKGGAFHVTPLGTTNDSDISDSTISGSSSISNSNNVILGSSSAKNDLYQKLPSNGRTRPKCDPTTGYGDCGPPSKFDSMPTGPDKTSYLMNGNRGSGPPTVTTIIRFPSTYTKGSSAIRFPTNSVGGSNGGGIPDQQHKPPNVGEPVAFPEMEISAASRYWDSNRYPASYWNPWDASKPHFVRIWPSNVAAGAATTYNMGSDINYNYRSHVDDYS